MTTLTPETVRHSHDGHLHDHGESGHLHGHNHAALTGPALALAFWLTSIVLVVDVVVGFRSGSLALLSDAMHVATDIFALGLAWWAVRESNRPANARKTFGYHRTTILAALTNALTLILLVFVIGMEAVNRLGHPHAVRALEVIPAAMLSIAINCFIVLRLHRTGSTDVNIRSAALHVMGDVGASSAVVVGALLMIQFHWLVVDPVLSLLIAALVVWEAWKIIAETINVLMEGTPRRLNIEELVTTVQAVPGVKSLHHLHVWHIASDLEALSCHLVLEDRALSECTRVLRRVEDLLTGRFHLGHTTIQLESEACGEALYCTIQPRENCCDVEVEH